MANTKGRGQVLNRNDLSDFFGVALPTVDIWIRRGCPYVTKGGPGTPWEFNSADVAKWLKDEAVEQATGNTSADEAELKRRKLAAETAKAELELARFRGDVAPVIEFERAQARAFAVIRQNILNVPQRAVLQLLGETDETAFKERLRAELVTALEQSAEAELDLDDDDDGSDPVQQ